LEYVEYEETQLEEKLGYSQVNHDVPRSDGYAKVTGSMQYGDDINAFRQLCAKTVYTRYPHADIQRIDISQALQVPGVVDIITAQDIPGNPVMFGRFPVLVADRARYIGDGVAVVAAETARIALHAASLVEVVYGEILKPVVTIEEALDPDCQNIHADSVGNLIDHASHHLELGESRLGFQESPIQLSRTYKTGFVDNGYIEPEVVLVEVDTNTGTVIVRGSIQNPYNIREAVAGVLGKPLNQVRVVQTAIGGSFGGKDESMMLIASRAAIIALRTGRPVKTVLSREESFVASAKRHPFTSDYRIGLAKDGHILALESTHHVQGGAYNKQAMFTNWRASIHAAGAYAVPNVRTDVDGVYTNTVFGGAYRGFSAPQMVFGIESLIDECAQTVGLNPAEFRLLNCLKPYDTIPSGQCLDPVLMPANLRELIDTVCGKTSFNAKWAGYQKERATASSHGIVKGIGLSVTYRGVGLGGEGIDTGAATVTIDVDGYVKVQSSFTEMGQGLSTTLCQIAAEVLGLPLESVSWTQNDTAANMDAGPTVASRGIVAGGNAVKNACGNLRATMATLIARKFNCLPEEIEFRDGQVTSIRDCHHSVGFTQAARICLKDAGVSLSAQGWYSPGPQSFDHHTGQGAAYPSYLFGASVAEISVDQGTGAITVEHLTSAIELGKAINPQIVRGQFIGGAIQGMGYAVMEEMDCHDGYMHTLNFDDFLIPGAMDVPKVDIVLMETDGHVGPYGAKGIGELGIEMIAPAIANAYANATGKRIRELPLNLERVVLGHTL